MINLKKYLLLKISFFCILSVLSSFSDAFSQTQLFASFTEGSNPSLTNWVFLKSKTWSSNTDGNIHKDEILLTQLDYRHNAAGFFYSQPYNPGNCGDWRAEFDYRIWDGDSADGLSFCFLDNIPHQDSLMTGSSIGLPANPKGLMVIFDTFNNPTDEDYSDTNTAFCQGPNPELILKLGDGNTNYDECNTYQRLSPVDILRQPEYNRMVVDYEGGIVSIYINDSLYMSGSYPLDFSGYFGFTSGNGGSHDNHSIKNIRIHTSASLLQFEAGQNQEICSGDILQLGETSKPEYNYLWSPSDDLNSETVSDPVFTHINTGSSSKEFIYIVNIDSTDYNCSIQDTVKITVNPRLIIDAGTDQQFCIGQNSIMESSIQGGTPSYIYAWSPLEGLNNPSVLKPIASPIQTTKYYLTVTDSKNCEVTDSLTIDVIPIPLPEVNLGNSFELCEGETAAIDAGNTGFNFIWSTGATSQTIEINTPGQYWVEVTPTGGCTKKADLKVLHCAPEIETFNFFTPTGDAHNETFYAITKHINQFEMEIYNRWGSRVFKTTEENVAWDGKNVSDGVYFWSIKLNGFDNYQEWQHLTGSVSLIKN